jgi:hypothetical protein
VPGGWEHHDACVGGLPSRADPASRASPSLTDDQIQRRRRARSRRSRVRAALQTLNEQGLTVLRVAQNATMAVAFADHSLVLVNGRIVLEGPRERMMGNEDRVRHHLGGAPKPN